MRTVSSRTTGISQRWGTSSGLNPEEDFEEPEDLSDIVGLDAEIPRGSARPSGGLLEPKAKPRTGIGLEVGKSAGGGLGIGVSIPIGGPISARGGVNIGAGGAIKGAQVGVGIGVGPIGASVDVGTDQDEEGRGGCYQYVTVTLGPFSHTYGKNVCEPKPPKEAPTPTPSPVPTIPTKITCSTGTWNAGGVGRAFDTATQNYEPVAKFYEGQEFADKILLFGLQVQTYNYLANLNVEQLKDPKAATTQLANQFLGVGDWYEEITEYTGYFPETQAASNGERTEGYTGFWYWNKLNVNRNAVKNSQISYLNGAIKIRWKYKRWCNVQNYRPSHLRAPGRVWGIEYDYQAIIEETVPPPSCPSGSPIVPPNNILYIDPPPAVPNPPPKKMDDKCCKKTLLMLAMLHKHHGVAPIPGMEQLDAFAGIKPKGEKFETEKMAFPFEVPKVWLDPTAKPSDRLPVRNVSELLLIMAAQSERLENFLGTKEFIKDSEGQLRGSETGILTWLTQRVTGVSGNDFTYPDPNDFWFNTDDGIINEKKVEVKSFADAVRYLVESQNRLERILPVAEIKDSTIPARWVYPGKKGQLRVGNLIHLVEYMFRADDRARGFWPQTVKIKDANPAIKGDQKIELKFESQADMLREILKFLIDTEGDGDISNNFALRNAIQSCQQHQLLVQNNAMLDAIVEYLDFKVKETTTKVPMPFSPFGGHEPSLIDKVLQKFGFGNKQLPGQIDKNTEEAIESLFEGVLQNTEVKVAIIEADEKKSLNESLLELLKHASAASAAVSERVTEGALQKLVDSAGIAQAVTRFLFKRDIAESNGVGDLDKWINSAEAGYTDKPESASLRFPESDPLEPYDRPIAENPKIQEIDTKDPKAD